MPAPSSGGSSGRAPYRRSPAVPADGSPGGCATSRSASSCRQRPIRRSKASPNTASGTCSSATSPTTRSRVCAAARSTARPPSGSRSLSPDRASDRAEMLAHHFQSAYDLTRAAGADASRLAGPARLALRDAGDRALSLNAFPAAARFFNAALDILLARSTTTSARRCSSAWASRTDYAEHRRRRGAHRGTRRTAGGWRSRDGGGGRGLPRQAGPPCG